MLDYGLGGKEWVAEVYWEGRLTAVVVDEVGSYSYGLGPDLPQVYIFEESTRYDR